MSTAFIFTAREGKPDFGSEYNRARFVQNLKDREGKKYRIEEDDYPVSDEMRGYYFGAVLPIVRKTCKEWTNLSGDDLHAVLKKEYCYFEAWSQKNKRMERYARNVMSSDKDNALAKQFLLDISEYLAGCGYEMPDPKVYKKFIDSAPLK